MQAQLGLFDPCPKKEREALRGIALETMSIPQLRTLAFLPEGGFPEGSDPHENIQTWLSANREAARRIRIAETKEFAARGSAQAWFSKWKPSCPALEDLAQGIEPALDVIAALYPPIKARGLKNPEDMGILMATRCGKAEGILAKQPAYESNSLLIEIHAVTGPWNVDTTTGEAQFEPGAKSRIFHLAYAELPDYETLEADLCAYPMVRDPSNAFLDRSGQTKTYRSEGLTGPKTKNGILLHRPWNSLGEPARAKLIALL